MNGVIKFRAWDKIRKIMLYNIEHSRDSRTQSFGDYIDYPDYYEVMQHIGYKDKNGKDIYEKDVVEIPSNGEKVLIKSCGMGFCGFLITDDIDCVNRRRDKFAIMLFIDNHNKCYVNKLGDAFENPEFLLTKRRGI